MTLATALLYDKNAAEDVVQDVFVTLIKSPAKFRLTRSLKGYLIACVANSARNRNKAGRRHPTLELDEVAPAVSASESPDLSAIFGEQLHQLARALVQLPYQQRETVLLHLYSDMKFKAIAKLQGESGDLGEAVRHYEKSLKLRPNSAEIHNNFANVLSELGRADDAVIHYKRALELKSNFAVAHYNLATLLAKQEDLEGAIQGYRQAVKIKPDY
ncbi:MAG: sigma-70 family RNA polymerase sigma factor, partial [Planctomycetota bacterium]